MDSRKDEQERGITMKSSSITLHYNLDQKEDYLINLIDSPGHVDFYSEVSTAVRLCDGAIVIVDVVEGVCPQTQVALKQAYMENIKTILVLNKIDRLILEMKFYPLDAYVHLSQILEQVNAVMGELFTSEILAREQHDDTPNRKNGSELYDWSSGLENEDDSNLYFSPECGNVVFASAADGWGFSIKDFAKLYSQKLGMNEKLLNKTLWGDYYLNSKTKKILKGAQNQAKKPLFVQLVLENIWQVYNTIVERKDTDKLQKIVNSLGIKMTPRDMRHTDTKVKLNIVCSQWMPLAKSVLEMVCLKLPNPGNLSETKIENLMSSKSERYENLPIEVQKLKSDFVKCSSHDDAPVIVFISKMFAVEKKQLPANKPKRLTQEEIALRRQEARERHAAMQKQRLENGSEANAQELTTCPLEKKLVPEEEDVFIAFARVFSGTLRSGQEVYVLGPKHDPRKALEMINSGVEIDPQLTLKDLRSNQHITKVKVGQIYLLMGRDLEALDSAPAGNIIGIGGLDQHVLKTATLSSTILCPSFSEITSVVVPILRVALEPVHICDLSSLVKGLKLLNQADACVKVLIQETGEHVIVTAGEVHLQRCLDDLTERFAKVPIQASEPIVPFRETIVEKPTVDRVNEIIIREQQQRTDTIITIQTSNKRAKMRIEALPLPPEVTNLLESNTSLLKLKPSSSPAQIKFKTQLASAFANSGDFWKGAEERIWSYGPRRCGPNVLLADFQMTSDDPRKAFENSLINGFQMATLSGPLCEEPMMGVCFRIHEWILDSQVDVSDPETSYSSPFGPFSGQIMSAVKEGCRRAFQAMPQRLMAAMYSCNIQANVEILGKLYSVLARRHGRVLHGDQQSGSAKFAITAVMPVVESFNFASDLRKQTSGLALPQLMFSHWEVIDIDPFWKPTTEEEYLHYGEKADTYNRARIYMDAVRKRKGLSVQEKIVQFAEKQRTLSKKK